jgi:hypothetical protein
MEQRLQNLKYLFIVFYTIQVVVCMLWIDGLHVFRNFYIFFYVCLILLIYIYISVSGYYENIFICIFYFKIVLNNLSLGMEAAAVLE